jgi:hypothetical protein
VAVDENDIPPPLLQMQGGRNADNSRTQDQNIGFDRRHTTLRT